MTRVTCSQECCKYHDGRVYCTKSDIDIDEYGCNDFEDFEQPKAVYKYTYFKAMAEFDKKTGKRKPTYKAAYTGNKYEIDGFVFYGEFEGETPNDEWCTMTDSVYGLSTSFRNIEKSVVLLKKGGHNFTKLSDLPLWEETICQK